MEKYEFNLFRRLGLFLFLAAIGCGLDLITKYFVFRHEQLFAGSEWWLWDGKIGIQKGLNEGALFGLGQGATGFFALISIAAAVAIVVWLFRFGAARDLALTIIMGFILGGILGNLYDRLGLHGMVWDDFRPDRAGEKIYAVRDWILFRWNEQWTWPNFNIADSFLVLGTISLFAHTWKISEPQISRPNS